MNCHSIAKSGLIISNYSLLFGGMFFHAAKLIFGRESIPPLTEHIGDFSFVAAPVCVTLDLENKIKEIGRKYESRPIIFLSSYVPEITSFLSIGYFVLGESILPQILPGRADINDIPAVLVAGLTSYLHVRLYKGWNR